jgi:biopolymer transport protein ExbD
MRIPQAFSHRQNNQQQTMTPLIDVVFLLLIFFVCASTGLMKEAQLQTKLSPGTSKAPDASELPPWKTPLWLKVTPRTSGNGVEIDLNGQKYASREEIGPILAGLAQAAPENPVILDIAPGVKYGETVQLHDLCRSLNFESINFAVDPK